MKKLVFLFCLIISVVPTLAQDDKSPCSDKSGKSPIITVTIDKKRVKPNERANVKITLTDCAGKPLDNRKVSTRIIFGEPVSGKQTPNNPEKDSTTDKSGVITDSVSSIKKIALSYVAMYEYADAAGNKQVAIDSEPLIVGDIFNDIGDKGKGVKMWLMDVSYEYQGYFRKEKADEILGMQTESLRTTSSGSLIILLKALISPDGTIIPVDGESSQINGFATFSASGENNYKDCDMHSNVYKATLDTENSSGSFNYETSSHMFTAQAYPEFKGIDKKVGYCPTTTISEERTGGAATFGAGGLVCELNLKDGAPLDGMFKCHFARFEDLTETKGDTEYSGFAFIRGNVEVEPLAPIVLGPDKKEY